jgi:hypothetical protein
MFTRGAFTCAFYARQEEVRDGFTKLIMPRLVQQRRHHVSRRYDNNVKNVGNSSGNDDGDDDGVHIRCFITVTPSSSPPSFSSSSALPGSSSSSIGGSGSGGGDLRIVVVVGLSEDEDECEGGF